MRPCTLRIASTDDDSQATSLTAAPVGHAPWCRTAPKALLIHTKPLHSRSVTAALLLTGDDLTVQDVWDVAVGRRAVALAESAVERMTQSRGLLDELRGEHTYGVNTGFGRFVSESIPDDQAEELQLRLLRSHACGVGEPYPDDVVRAAMLLRANAIAKGYSGARVETVELLLAVLTSGIVPYVPARGSVGASGDLAPLAHLALPLVGEGEAFCHIHASPDGRYWVSDSNRSARVFVGSLATGRHRLFCSTGSTFGSAQYTHPHPFFLGDGRAIGWNSDVTGVPHVYYAKIPDGFLGSLD